MLQLENFHLLLIVHLTDKGEIIKSFDKKKKKKK